jgi:hypothetical protein
VLSADDTFVTRALMITTPVEARFVVRQGFTASDVHIIVVRNTDAATIAISKHGGVAVLEPAEYSVQIRDSGTPMQSLQVCARFTLIFALVEITLPSGPGVCAFDFAPAVLNTIAYLSPYSAYTTHFQRPLLADTPVCTHPRQCVGL